jgi:plasmid stability protein
MDAVRDPGGVDRFQKTRFEQGLRSIELEVRADCEAEEITHLGLAGHEATEAFERLAVDGFHRIGFLPKPSLKITV